MPLCTYFSCSKHRGRCRGRHSQDIVNFGDLTSPSMSSMSLNYSVPLPRSEENLCFGVRNYQFSQGEASVEESSHRPVRASNPSPYTAGALVYSNREQSGAGGIENGQASTTHHSVTLNVHCKSTQV